jgi:hypothetical protein
MKHRGAAALGVARVALCGAALLAVGCNKPIGAEGGCAVAGDCGGDPTGLWQVAATCSYPVVSRPAQNYDSTRGYFAPETGAMSPAVTSGSWCWDLTFDGMGNLVTPATPMPNPDIVTSGTVEFAADHTYTYTLTASSVTPFHVARSCFGAGGQGTTCDQLAMKIQSSTIGVNPVYSNAARVADNTTPAFACHDAGDGCDCTFDYIETIQNAVGDKGAWVVDGSVIHHYSVAGQGNLNEMNPSRRTVRDATFCVEDNGQTLQLSGTDGQLLALKNGLRTLKLTRVVDPTSQDAAAAGGDEAGLPPLPDPTVDAGADAAQGVDAAATAD